MKNKDLFLIILVFLLFSSCNDDNEKKDDKYDKPSALYFMSVTDDGFNKNDGLSGIEWLPEEYEESSLWCTGDDIEWFDATTRTFKTNIELPYDVFQMPSSGKYLILYLDEKPLIRFEAITIVSSIETCSPSITTKFKNKQEYLILKCYPPGDPICDKCEENWKAIEPEWNIFIEQLKKEGRYRE